MITLEQQTGDIPLPRFGHTTTLVDTNRVILFGGAAPSARAAHAAACVETDQLVVYGGAIGGGNLSSDELNLLDYRNQQARWMSVPTSGTTPGRRYGHSLVFNKPTLIVFGGNNGQE